jgi:two-component sensor histidine kinase
VATLPELARLHTRLNGDELSHLTRLVASWGILADLCFADLLLFVPVVGGDGRFIVLGQVRPTTSQTLHADDLVGRIIDEAERPLVARAFRTGEIMDGEVAVTSRGGEPARLQCIPVRHHGGVVGVLTREAPLTVGRRPGELERSYTEVFERFARMLVAGCFPYPVDEGTTAESPRVGDGVLLLDETARVVYASPNAVNALHRMGVYSNAEGVRLDEVGVESDAIDEAWEAALPVTEEVERRPDVIVLLRVLPLLEVRTGPSGPAERVGPGPSGPAERLGPGPSGLVDPDRKIVGPGGMGAEEEAEEGAERPRVSGAIVLLRDVSDVRRRDRLLLSKDATIREVHHRVKNNLQTIGSLLRLQARRLAPGEGREALAEAERRIRSIALVHEILSREAGEQVPFDQIVAFLVRMAEDASLSPEVPVRFSVEGSAGELPATLATPLAVVLSELLQNAVEHGYPDGSAGGLVRIELDNDGSSLHVVVRDDGRGLPAGFTIDRTRSLGLSIARDLVTSQMGGTITLSTADGATVELDIPVPPPETLPG